MPYLHSRDPAAGPVYLIRPGMGVSIVHRPPIDQDGDPVGFPGMRLIVLDNRVYTPLYKLFDFSRGQADNLIEAEYRSAAEVVVYDEDIDDTFDVLYDPTQPGLVYVKYQTILYIQLPGVDAVTLSRATCVVLREDREIALRERERRQHESDSPESPVELQSQLDQARRDGGLNRLARSSDG
ncbi:hypothetical protein B2J93_4344 [Marssonina coronariae]|uniref:Uncharacterized protein n=1 Tax=Diplocarpon coronariae TaxID=2795749 RepID=A0A218ZFA1_9HELO|nr:hypothetical protein B2J93_4344 [Marssonina coronariae]